METQNNTLTPLPRDPQELLRMGLLIGNAIIATVFNRPLPCLPPKESRS